MHLWLRLVYRVRSACRVVRRCRSETHYLILHVAVSPVTNTIGTRGDHENSTKSEAEGTDSTGRHRAGADRVCIKRVFRIPRGEIDKSHSNVR